MSLFNPLSVSARTALVTAACLAALPASLAVGQDADAPAELDDATGVQLARGGGGAPSLFATGENETRSTPAVESDSAGPATSLEETEEVPTPEEAAAAPHRVRTEAGDDADPMDDRAITDNIHFAPGGGLRISSEDGHFGVRIGSRVQLRWTAQALPGEDAQHEITLRRARIKITGNVFEHVHFKLELALSPADLGVRDNLDPDLRTPTRSPLLDYHVDLRYLRDLELRVGQWKVPSNRQRIISSANLQLVDRSMLNSEFTLDRDVGLAIGSRDLGGIDMLSYSAGVFSGRGRDARGFGDFNLMYLGRVDFTPLGSFEDYAEADFDRGGPRLSIGAAYGFVDRGARERGTHGQVPEDGGTTTSHHVFGDMVFKYEGLSVLGEVAWRDGDRALGDALGADGLPIPMDPARDGWGVNAQMGYMLPWFPLEVAGRYATVRGLENSSLNDGHELTGGLSYYVMEHAYKIQVDYSRLWQTDGMDDGADRVRVQMQLTL